MNVRLLCPDGHPVVFPVARLGDTAICPHCYVGFIAELAVDPCQHARSGAGKSRRARDEDDDDEDEEEDQPRKKAKPPTQKDDEKPRKKSAPRKDDDDDEEEDDEKPRKKAKPRQIDDDDDDDDDDDEEEEETPKKKARAKKSNSKDEDEDDDEGDDKPEPEPIEWTPRKRQLLVCSNGLVSLIVANYILMGFVVFCSLAIDAFEILDDWKRPFLGPLILDWVCVPLFCFSVVAVIVSACFNFKAPAKVEGKGALIATLVFGFLIFFLGFLVILNYFEVLTSDAVRSERFLQLLVGSALVCFVLCLVSMMAFLSKLFAFMRLNMEASQPITNCGFYFLYLGLMLGLVYASPLLKSNIGDWVCYIVALLADVISGFAVYVLVLQIILVNKVRFTIEKYIKEA
ncbi:MAG: hypothetical protein HYX68_18540 [Planctomycetes bacterium]|nr:hypothetical protein [Planctomycetota bacterium]